MHDKGVQVDIGPIENITHVLSVQFVATGYESVFHIAHFSFYYSP